MVEHLAASPLRRTASYDTKHAEGWLATWLKAHMENSEAYARAPLEEKQKAYQRVWNFYKQNPHLAELYREYELDPKGFVQKFPQLVDFVDYSPLNNERLWNKAITDEMGFEMWEMGQLPNFNNKYKLYDTLVKQYGPSGPDKYALNTLNRHASNEIFNPINFKDTEGRVKLQETVSQKIEDLNQRYGTDTVMQFGERLAPSVFWGSAVPLMSYVIK